MKRAALLLALSGAGCNSWFGLDQTHEIAPDAIDAPPPTATVNVVYRVGLTSGTTGSTSDVAIPGAIIRAGATDLVEVPYDVGGNATVPLSLTTAPWRLEVTAPGQTPLEVQWMPTNAQLCLPRWGRLDRPPVADDSHIRMTVNTPGLRAPQILTSGVWTQTELSSTNNPIDLVWAPNVVFPLDGALSPIGDGDWMMLVDYSRSTSDPGTHEATAYARVDPAVLDTTVTVNLNATFVTEKFKVELSSLATSPIFSDAGLVPSNLYAARVGLIASTNMPAQPFEGGTAKMFAFGEYDQEPSSDFAVIDSDLQLPHAVQVSRISRRTYKAVNLDSAIERLDLGSISAYPDDPSHSIPVGIATNTHLDGTSLANDGVVVPTLAGDASVSWTTADGDGTPTIAVVTLDELQGTKLVPIKQFVTTGTSVVVEQALLASNKDYVFEIALRTGFPNAASGDLCTVSYPMFDTRVLTGAFSVR